VKIKNSKYRIICYVAVLLYISLHFITLSIFPLPWYDETYMAAIGKAFLETGDFTKTLALYTDIPTQDLRYGPVYFFFVAFVFKFFGFGIFQYRLISLFAGFWTLWLTYKLFKSEKNSEVNTIALVAFLAIDSFYFRCMHEGRMDLLASGFMLSASLLLLKVITSNELQKIVIWMLSAGILSAISLLTSPRLGFALPFVAVYLIYHFLKHKTSKIIIAALGFLLPFFILYSLWIFYAHGSYSAFISFYLENLGYTRLNGYPYYIPRQQIPLLAVALVTVVVGIYRLKWQYFSPLTIWALIHIAAYYLIVYDNGPYASLIFPYLYILIFTQVNVADWQKVGRLMFKE